MITNKLVNEGIDYIMQHLDEEITIEDVANYCHFSKYYFSRVFKEETGESIYAFIKRLKMDQSALRLKIEKEKSITDIGVNYGYSSSNYSTVFKKHHSISPAEFRKIVNTTDPAHPFFTDQATRYQSLDEYNQKISIREFDDFFVIYERRIGNYIKLGDNWCDFTEKYQEYMTEDTLLIERSYDDPSITDLDQCLYDICMTVDKNCPLENVTVIPGGKFAVYRYAGPVTGIFFAFQGIFNIWLPHSRYEMDERYGLDIYREIDRENIYVVMDLCIPVKLK
jgi:AraC family transcriptional regulator